MDVYFLWHVRHAASPDGSSVEHRDAAGRLQYSDEDDTMAFIGVYSTRDLAREAADRARTSPVFADEPDCFFTDVHTLDADVPIEV